MRRLIPALAVALLLPVVSQAQTSTWKPDPAHSGVDFSILHLGISKVRGHFAVAGGEVTWDEKDITKSKVNITINTASVDTQNSRRDDDLKTAKFFDTATYPTGTFTSTSINKATGGLTINGNLTLHGVTKPVTLQVEGPNGPVPGMDKKPHAGFSATTTLTRSAFNIGGSYPTAVVGDEVKLTIDLDLGKQ